MISQTALKEAIKRTARRELFRKSYLDFFIYFWDTVVSDPLVMNFHIEVICEELQKVGEAVFQRQVIPDLVINVPPAESKSTIVSILFPAWLWCRDPSLRIISGSYAKALSQNHTLKTRDCIESDKFRDIFSDMFELKKDQNTKSYYVNDQGGDRVAVSTGSAVTGLHGHLLIIDDPINPIQAESQTELQTANRWIFETLSTRKVDRERTPTVLVMQRLAEGDPTDEFISRRSNVTHICLPAEKTADVRPAELADRYVDDLMNPNRNNRQVLDDFKRLLGSRSYAGQFLQTPRSAEGNIFRRSWFKTYEKKALEIKDVSFYLDTAYTSKASNDPTAIIAFKKVKNELFLINCVAVRLEFPELIKFVQVFVKENGYTQRSRIYVEPKASGKSVVQQLRKESSLNVIEDDPPKDSKVVRATAVTPLIESGRVLVPNKDRWLESFFDEVTTFPNSKHDDRVDALVGAINKTLINSKGISTFVSSNR